MQLVFPLQWHSLRYTRHHACTREREFLEIVADRHDDHVSEVFEEDARRFAKTLVIRTISKPTTKDTAVNEI